MRIAALLLAASVMVTQAGCSTATIVTAPADLLRNHRIVAAAPVELVIEVKESSRKSAVAALQKFVDLSGLKDRGIALDKDFLTPNTPTFDNFQDFLAETVNKNFLARGYMPIERTRLKAIMKEIGLQNTGLVDQEKALQAGKLARADAIYLGRFLVQVDPQFLSTKVRIHFAGRLVSVERGIILMSGEQAAEETKGSMKDFTNIIDEWFAPVRPLKP